RALGRRGDDHLDPAPRGRAARLGRRARGHRRRAPPEAVAGRMSIRAAVTVARHALLRVVRDPPLLVFGIGLPALLMFLIGSTFYGGGSVDLGVLDLDRTPASSRMVERLEQLDGVELHRYDRVATLRRDVRTSTRTAGFVIPDGFEAASAAGTAEVGV